MKENNFTVSVIVPTYKRPAFLERCFESLVKQSKLPEEIILVSRDDDYETINKIREIIVKFKSKCHILHEMVSVPGFLPPIEKGISVANKDIIAFIDDDAEAHSDWVEKLLTPYGDKKVGGVGGRVVNYFYGQLVEYPPVRIVGKLYWFGRSVGDMYKDTISSRPQKVNFFMGGNMSFRRELLALCSIDEVLKRNVSFSWELDIALQIQRNGLELLFLPNAKVDHHSAPREEEGLRSVNYEGVYWSNHNYSYIILKHGNLMEKLGYIIYTTLVGSTLSMGVAAVLVKLIRREKVDWRNDMVASIKGRVAGIKSYFQGRKNIASNY